MVSGRTTTADNYHEMVSCLILFAVSCTVAFFIVNRDDYRTPFF